MNLYSQKVNSFKVHFNEIDLMIFFIFLLNFRSFSPKTEKDQNTSDLPDSYNFLEEFPECDFGNILSICNASHAFTVLKALSHRFCRKLRKSIILSSSYLVKCDIIDEVCHSSCQIGTYKFFERNGVPDINCHPYQTNKNNKNKQKKNLNENTDKKQQNWENNIFSTKFFYDYQSSLDDKNFDDDKSIQSTNCLINKYFKKSKKERNEFGNFHDYMAKRNEKNEQKNENSNQNYYSFCTKCQNEENPFNLYRTKANSTRRLKTVAEMKRAIYERGPITVTIATDNHFKNYKNGIYISSISQTTEAGDYTIELIGWGTIHSFDGINFNRKIHNYNVHLNREFVEHDIFYGDVHDNDYYDDDLESQNLQSSNQYWIGVDNRGDEWGENGMIKILLGSNQGLVESFAYEADPM